MRDLMKHPEWDFEMVSDENTEAGIRGIDPKLAEKPVEQGGLVWTFVKNRRVFGPKLPFLWQSGLSDRLKNSDYDAVIFLGNLYFLSTWWAVHKLKKRKVPTFYWTHGLLGKDGKFMSMIRNLFYRQADGCFLYGERSKRLMLKTGHYREEQLQVVYNSLDYGSMKQCRDDMTAQARDDLRRSLFTNAALPIIVAVGRVNQVKRFDLLLEAVQRMSLGEKQYNCLIIGEGPELANLRRQAASLGSSAEVCFYGSAYGDEVDRLMLASDLCVIPGDIGLSAMHAMSGGLPVISHDALDRQMPEHEAIVEGETGSFYRYGSIETLTEKIEWWVSDPERMASARIRCLELMENKFSSSYQVKKITETLDLYRNDSKKT